MYRYMYVDAYDRVMTLHVLIDLQLQFLCNFFNNNTITMIILYFAAGWGLQKLFMMALCILSLAAMI